MLPNNCGHGLILDNFDIVITTFGTSILGAQIKNGDSKESQASFEFYNFRPVLRLKISVEQWFLGLLLRTLRSRALQNLQNTHFQRRKKDLWSYHCPNYFSGLVPGGNTSFLFYKNSFYKNHEAENRPKIKNFIRITPGPRSRDL